MMIHDTTYAIPYNSSINIFKRQKQLLHLDNKLLIIFAETKNKSEKCIKIKHFFSTEQITLKQELNMTLNKALWYRFSFI